MQTGRNILWAFCEKKSYTGQSAPICRQASSNEDSKHDSVWKTQVLEW